jgi:hypothetical protein
MCDQAGEPDHVSKLVGAAAMVGPLGMAPQQSSAAVIVKVAPVAISGQLAVWPS